MRREEEVKHVEANKVEKVVLWILRYIFFGWVFHEYKKWRVRKEQIKKFGTVINDEYLLDHSYLKRKSGSRRKTEFFLCTEIKGQFTKQKISYDKYKFFEAMGVPTSKGHLTSRNK